MITLRSILCTVLVALCAAAPASAQRGGRKQTPRERWEKMDPAERELLRRRFREFKKLSSEQRLLLLEHGIRIEERRERSVEDLKPGEREILESLDPELRRRVLRDHFHQRSLEDGRRVKDKLPREVLRQLEEADPTARLELLAEFRRAQRAREGLRLLDLLGDELDIPAEERAAWKDRTAEEQGELLLELGRRFTRIRVAELGPPAGLTAEEWSVLDTLSNQAFFDAWRRIEPSPEYLPRPRTSPAPAARAPGAVTAPPTRRWTEDGRQTAQDWRRVRELAKPDVGDLADLADLPPAERRTATAARGRERTLAFIRENELLSPEELAKLEALDGSEYMDALRRLARARFTPR